MFFHHNFNSLTVSGIGRVLPFYSKCSRVIPEIKRAADNLISKYFIKKKKKKKKKRKKLLSYFFVYVYIDDYK